MGVSKVLDRIDRTLICVSEFVSHRSQAAQASVAIAIVACCLVPSGIAQTVTGSGTSGNVPVFTGTSTLGNSPIAVSGGNVGIGTTSPTAILDINGGEGAPASSGAMDTGIIIAKSTGGVAMNVGVVDTGNPITGYGWLSAAYVNSANVTENFSLQPNGGNVGIGTTLPYAKLDIWAGSEGQTGPVTALMLEGPNLPANSNSAQDMSWSFHSAGSSRIRAYRGSSYDTYLQFLTNSAGQGSDSPQVRMHIDQSGNVGIGTTSPGAVLEVNGNVKLTSGSGASITFADGTTQSTAYTGTCTATGGDYAESVDVIGEKADYEPGDVMVIDPKNPGHFLLSSGPYSRLVAGIYSTKPGYVGRR